MQHLGLNGDVQAGGHRFHVQTTYSASSEKIISHVFEQGRLIDQHEVHCPGTTPAPSLSAQLRTIHFETMGEMELLFLIAEKVRRVKHLPSYLRLGALFLEKNLPEEALAVLQQAITLAPDMPEAYQRLGRALLHQKELAEAERVFRLGLQCTPQYADLHHDLGLALLAQEQLVEALPCFATALQINPRFAHAHLSRALTLLLTLQGPQPLQDHLPPSSARLKQIQDDLQALRQNARTRPDAPAVKAALTALARKDYVEAATALRQVSVEMLAASERVYENEFYLKFMFGGKSRNEAFIQNYVERLQTAAQDFPEYADLRNHLGIAHLIQSRNLFLRAIEDFREALKINSDYQRAEKNLKLTENDSRSFVYLLRAMLR